MVRALSLYRSAQSGFDPPFRRSLCRDLRKSSHTTAERYRRSVVLLCAMF